MMIAKTTRDETVFAKFMLRQVIINDSLSDHCVKLGFYEESDIPFVEIEQWDIIYILLDVKYKYELKKMLCYIFKPMTLTL